MLSGRFYTEGYTSSSGDLIRLLFSWTATQFIEENYSLISWKLTGSRNGGGYVSSGGFQVSINDESVWDTSSRVDMYNGTVVASGTKKLYHDSEGKCSFSAYAKGAIYWYAPTYYEGSGEWDLDTIPRASVPTVSASTVAMGGSVTVYTNRASDAFTHELSYAFQDGTTVVASGNIADGVGASYKWQIPDMAAKIPGKTSGTCIITCITKNGTTTVGTKTVQLTLNVPAASVPTVSVSTAAMPGEVTIYTNRASDAFTHEIWYTFGGVTERIAEAAGDDCTWTFGDMSAQIPNKTRDTCTISCITKNGTATVGEKTVTLTLTVPAASSFTTAPAGSAQMLSTVEIRIARLSEAFTHELTYSIAGAGISGTIDSGITENCQWQIPDLASQLSGGGAVCTITCKTFNGTAYVGMSTAALTLTPPGVTAPTVSNSRVKMGETVIIYTNRLSTAYTHTLSYQVGAHTGDIEKNVGESCQWEVPKSLAAYTEEKTEAECVITCKTIHGASVIAEETVTITLIVPDATQVYVSPTTVTLGDRLYVSTASEADVYVHDLTFTLGGEVIDSKTDWGYGVYYITLPLDLAQKISGTSATVNVRCVTRFDGSDSVVGSTSASFTVTVPEDDRTTPSVEMAISAETPLIYSDQTYLSGKSRINVSYAGSSAGSGAEITSWKTEILGKEYTGENITSDVLTQTGTVVVKGTITNSRGYSTTQTREVTVQPYRRPRVIPGEGESSIVCRRCKGPEDPTPDNKGTCLLIRAGRSYIPFVYNDGQSTNGCQLSMVCEEAGIENRVLLESNAEDDYVEVIFEDVVTDTKQAYQIQLIALDLLDEPDVITIPVPSAFATWHTPIGGHGFTLGGYHDPDKVDVFDCLFDAEFEGDVYGRVVGLGALPAVTTGNSKEPGAYAITAVQAGSILGLPENPGVLQVWNADGLDDETTLYRMQEFIRADNAGDYRRSLSRETVDDAWSEGAWKVKTWGAV